MEKYKEIISLLDNELKNIKEEKGQLEFNIANFGKKRVRDFDSAEDFAIEKSKMDEAVKKLTDLAARATLLDGFYEEAESIEAEYNEAKTDLDAAKKTHTNKKSRNKIVEYFEEKLETATGVAEVKLSALEANIKNIDSLTNKVVVNAKGNATTKKTAKVVKTSKASEKLSKKSKKTAVIVTTIMLATAMLCGTAIYVVKSLGKKDKPNTKNDNVITSSEIVENTPEVTPEITVTPEPTLSPEEMEMARQERINEIVNNFYNDMLNNNLAGIHTLSYDKEGLSDYALLNQKEYRLAYAYYEKNLAGLDEKTVKEGLKLYFIQNIIFPLNECVNDARIKRVRENLLNGKEYSFEPTNLWKTFDGSNREGIDTLKKAEELSYALECATTTHDWETFDKLSTEAKNFLLVVFPKHGNVLESGEKITFYSKADGDVEYSIYLISSHMIDTIVAYDEMILCKQYTYGTFPEDIAPCYSSIELRTHINMVRPSNVDAKSADYGYEDSNYYCDDAADKIIDELYLNMVKLEQEKANINEKNTDTKKLTLG